MGGSAIAGEPRGLRASTPLRGGWVGGWPGSRVEAPPCQTSAAIGTVHVSERSRGISLGVAMGVVIGPVWLAWVIQAYNYSEVGGQPRTLGIMAIAIPVAAFATALLVRSQTSRARLGEGMLIGLTIILPVLLLALAAFWVVAI